MVNNITSPIHHQTSMMLWGNVAEPENTDLFTQIELRMPRVFFTTHFIDDLIGGTRVVPFEASGQAAA